MQHASQDRLTRSVLHSVRRIRRHFSDWSCQELETELDQIISRLRSDLLLRDCDSLSEDGDDVAPGEGGPSAEPVAASADELLDPHEDAAEPASQPQPVAQDADRRRLIRWQRGLEIGKGAFGTVCLGMNIDTGELMAVKSIELSMLNSSRQQQQLQQIHQEIQLMRRLRHRHIVRYLGAEFRQQKFNVLLEYCPGGSVAGLIKNFGALSESLARNFIRDALLGLAFLHTNHIIHRDIKGGNILVDHGGCVKLADFGCSKELEGLLLSDSGSDVGVDRSGEENLRDNASIKGSPYWMAPEVVRGHGNVPQSDVWAIGCVVIEMMTGLPPFSHLHPISAMYNIGNTRVPPPFPSNMSSEGRDFLTKCLQVDPQQRFSAARLLEHPWLRNGARQADVFPESRGSGAAAESGDETAAAPLALPGLLASSSAAASPVGATSLPTSVAGGDSAVHASGLVSSTVSIALGLLRHFRASA